MITDPFLWAVVLAVLTVIDLVSTLVAISMGAHEANPVMAYILRMPHGRVMFIAVKLAYAVLLLCLIDSVSVWVFVFLSVVYLCVVVWNLRVIRSYRGGVVR